MKILLALVKPKFFIPIHGEYKQMWFHSKIAQELGTPKENIFLCENGDQIQLSSKSGKIVKKVPASSIYIDGASVGDIGTSVLKERSRLARDGFMVISVSVSKLTREVLGSPEITSLGFIYVKESSDTYEEVKRVVLGVASNWKGQDVQVPELKRQIKDNVSEFLLENTRRIPLVIPTVIQI